MKHSNRYATRYTAKKKVVALMQKIMDSQERQIKDLENLLFKERGLRDKQNRGITTIRIGDPILGFRSDIIEVIYQVRVDDLLFAMRMKSRDAKNLTAMVRDYCREICHKMEIGIVEHATKTGLLRNT